MDDAVKKHVATYFSTFYKLTQKLNTFAEKSKRPISALKNQSEQLTSIERAEIEEFTDFPDLKEKLVFKIYIGIDEELRTIRTIVNNVNTEVQDLKQKLVILERSTINIDWDDINRVGGTALYPSLSDLLQMALNGWTIFSDLNNNLDNALKSLDVRNPKTLNQLIFYVNENEEGVLNKIIALTQYTYNNE